VSDALGEAFSPGRLAEAIQAARLSAGILSCKTASSQYQHATGSACGQEEWMRLERRRARRSKLMELN
jgi:hypothetical protein